MTPEQIIGRLKVLIEEGSLPYDDMGYCLDCRWRPEDVPMVTISRLVAHDQSCIFLAISPGLNDGSISMPDEKAL